LKSIRSFFRARRNSERGFALLVALALAVLYFAFIELLMIDAARSLGEARRFRARIVALTLAENGAELAAAQMVTRPQDTWKDKLEDWQGISSGTMTKGAGKFDIVGEARSAGLEPTNATVHLEGRIEAGPSAPSKVVIEHSRHSQ
jgi:hypothetical protein